MILVNRVFLRFLLFRDTLFTVIFRITEKQKTAEKV